MITWTLILYLANDPVVMPVMTFQTAQQCAAVQNKVLTKMSKKIVGAECAHISFNDALDKVRLIKR